MPSHSACTSIHLEQYLVLAPIWLFACLFTSYYNSLARHHKGSTEFVKFSGPLVLLPLLLLPQKFSTGYGPTLLNTRNNSVFSAKATPIYPPKHPDRACRFCHCSYARKPSFLFSLLQSTCSTAAKLSVCCSN